MTFELLPFFNTKNMKVQILKEILREYINNFEDLNEKEIYKWTIIRHFQKNWNIDESDFYKMLIKALDGTENLLTSGNYYAKSMLLQNTEYEPETVKKIFIDLFNEDESLYDRVEKFIINFNKLNQKYFKGENSYQDHRAVMVYLTLRYPHKYYFYKFGMFKSFANLVDYPNKPKRGSIKNILYYNQLCHILKLYVLNNQQLIKLHYQRILKRGDAFTDSNFNILVQDIIYAATNHFQLKNINIISPKYNPIIFNRISLVELEEHNTFKGQIIDFKEVNREKNKLGVLGEIFIMKLEHQVLIDSKKKPEHKSVSEGDGLGYDILSFDENGNEKYIEVKTTKGKFETPFYITKRELERSKIDADNYYLYRVYNFDEESGVGELEIIKGNLEEYCKFPELYKVKLIKE